jgi:hypothetical protein
MHHGVHGAEEEMVLVVFPDLPDMGQAKEVEFLVPGLCAGEERIARGAKIGGCHSGLLRLGCSATLEVRT